MVHDPKRRATADRPDQRDSHSTPDGSAAWLRRHLEAQLHRHLRCDGPAPMTVIGLVGSSIEVLGRGIDHPEDAIVGLVVPRHMSAVGVIASSIVMRPSVRRHDDGVLAIGVNRDDEVVTLLATRSGGTIDTHHPQGWLIDSCRRALGLATEPCLVSAVVLPLVIWLDRIMVRLIDPTHSQRLGWSEAIDLCPVPGRLRARDPVDLGLTIAATTVPWPALRASAARGGPCPVALAPTLAGWMDDAMFARWCVGSYPDLANLRADVEFLAPADVAERIEIVLRTCFSALPQ